AVGAECEPRAEVRASVIRRLYAEDHADITHAPIVLRQHATGDRGAIAALARLCIAPEDGAVVREVRTQGNIEQAALAAGIDPGQSADRLAQCAVGGYDAHAARPLRHEQAPIRQRLDRPRMFQPARDNLDIEGDAGTNAARACLTFERRLLIATVRRLRLQRDALRIVGRVLRAAGTVPHLSAADQRDQAGGEEGMSVADSFHEISRWVGGHVVSGSWGTSYVGTDIASPGALTQAAGPVRGLVSARESRERSLTPRPTERLCNDSAPEDCRDCGRHHLYRSPAAHPAAAGVPWPDRGARPCDDHAARGRGGRLAGREPQPAPWLSACDAAPRAAGNRGARAIRR